MNAHQALLESIINRYLESRDFNGKPLDVAERKLALDLVRAGQVQVVSGDRVGNPNIRPWNDRPDVADQLADLEAGQALLCAYPTPQAMTDRSEVAGMAPTPFRQRIAGGVGQMELAFFTVDVVEAYKNDPRYHYDFSDFEIAFGVTDETYLDPAGPERDHNPNLRVGFAYDTTTIDAASVTRRLCAFMKDLSRLTPEHQRRWETFEVQAHPMLQPHPVWYAWMMGSWENGVGPFARILAEMDAINSLSELIAGLPMFRSTEKPHDWGWVLRPTTREWEGFMLTTDKLLSDNLKKKTFDALGVPESGPDGVSWGTLMRLEWFLVNRAGREPELVRGILAPLRRVRKLRQQPAHSLSPPSNDKTVTAQQRDILKDIGDALQSIRIVLSTHPSAIGWDEPDVLAETMYRL